MNHRERQHAHEPPQISRSGRVPLSKGQRAAWGLILGSLLFLGCAVTAPFWFPRAVRAIVPDRYIVAYAPSQFQDWIFSSDADQNLPTAVPSGVGSSSDLLLQIVPTDNASNTPLPTIDLGGESTNQPSSGILGQAQTPTAAFSVEGPAEPTVVSDLPVSYRLEPFTHTYQGWNNCGPATLTTALSYWDIVVKQSDVAGFVKPNPEDRNVRPDELVAYANSLGYQGIVRVNGDLLLIKRLLTKGFPVIVETGFDPEPDRLGWMGHYLVLTGYSDQENSFTAMDSYLGPDTQEDYSQLDRFWRHFNRTYIVVYPPSSQDVVYQVLGEDVDDRVMYHDAIMTAQSELEQDPADAFGWFNMGSSLVALGDYQGAAAAYDQARSIGVPWRMLWYQFGPYEAYLQLHRYEDVLTLAGVILADNEYSEEAYYYRGRVYVERGQIPAARAQFNLALRNNSHYAAAQAALDALGN